MNLKQALEVLAKDQNIKKVSINKEELIDIEFFESKAQAQSAIDLIKAIGTDEMPP